MQRVNDLVVRGNQAEVAKLVERIERNNIVADWRRDRDSEERLESTSDGALSTYCFKLVNGPLRPVMLILTRRGWEELYVMSIVTLDGDPLSDVEYNRILGDFHANVLVFMSVGIKVLVEMRPPRMELEEFLSSEAMDRLREFSIASAKGDDHVPDLPRWHRFVIQAHLDGCYLDSEDLDYWLMGDGFSPEDRRDLLISFAEGRNFLREYDEARVP